MPGWPAASRYAARDVAHLHDLLGVMETELEMVGLDTVWALESALLPTVVGMEATGIRVDREKLESIAAEADRQAQQATDDLRAVLAKASYEQRQALKRDLEPVVNIYNQL